MLTLEGLLDRVGVKHYDRVLWFGYGKPEVATLQGNVLLMPDATCGRYAANCWGAQMREHIPDIRIRARPEKERAQPKSKTWNKAGQAHMRRLGFE